VTSRLLLMLLVLAPFTPVRAHSGEWTPPGPAIPSPPDPLPKWPGPITLNKPTDLNPEPTGTPGRRVDRSRVRSGWSAWWYLHRERILDIESIAAPRRAAPGPDEDSNRGAVLAALRKYAAAPSEDIRTSAIIALGRARDARIVPRLIEFIRADDSSAALVESSLLALGLIGGSDPEVRKLIPGVLADPGWSSEVRSCAALALGFTGDAAFVPSLTARLGAKETDKGVRAAAAAGLGILSQDAAAPDLARALVGPDGREVNPGTRAYAAAALGALATGTGRTALMQALRDLDLGVSRQAALSLGVHSDPWARAALLKTFETEGDSLTRAYAALALSDAGEAKAREVLRKAGREGDDVLAPHAVVALGLLARRTRDAKTKAEVILLVQTGLTDLTGDDRAGALVIAGALAGADGLAGRYGKICRSGAGSELRGHAAVALGILGGDATVLAEMVTAETPPPLLREVGAAGALLASRRVQAKFRALFLGTGPESARCVAAVSLGLFRRDSKATTDALLGILTDEKQPELVRACAAVGLGRRLEKESPSRLALSGLRLSPGLAVGPFREVMSMR